MKENDTTFLSKSHPSFTANGYLYQLVKDRKLTKVKHNHDFFELFFILQGEVEHNVDGQMKKMREMDFTFLAPKNMHFFEGQTADAYVFSLSLTPEKFARMLSAADFSPAYGKVYTAKNKRFLKELPQIPTFENNRQKLLVNAFVMDLLTEIVKNNLPFDKEIPHPLQLAVEQLRRPEHIGGGVGKLAELTGYSRMHLGRLVKKYYGKTPAALLHDIRMSLAAEYLEKTSFTLERIAEDVGFASVSQFHAAFKTQYECTPSVYRKRKQIPTANFYFASRNV